MCPLRALRASCEAFLAAAAAEKAAAASSSSAPQAAPQLSADDKWAILVNRLPQHAGGWVFLPDFLKEVGEPTGHPKRYVAPTGEETAKLWKVGPNSTSAVYLVDWDKRQGNQRRGGYGGKVHAHVNFLRTVFVEKYAITWKP